MKELTLARLKHHSFSEEFDTFTSLYEKLFFDDELSNEDINKVLSLTVVFTKQKDEVMRKLGYRMALAYGNKTQDFTPLYDIAINSGIIPLVSLINDIGILTTQNRLKSKNSFMHNIVDSYIDNFRQNEIVLTEQQFVLNSFFDKNLNKTTTIIAPTSYGKSELIVSAIKNSEGKKICIIVPSKALLAQTRKRVLDAKIDWVKKIISHPEMHVVDSLNSVYILTQERLTRILNQDGKAYFDIVIVDEAHNILDKDDRNILLASVIRILEHRSKKTGFKFLTPFLKDSSSLMVKNSQIKTNDYKVNEYVKSERIYIADYRDNVASLEFYDHFTGEFVLMENDCKSFEKYIFNHAENKNLIYFNRPKHIQEFAVNIARKLPMISSQLIEEAINEIKLSTHKDYLLLYCLKRGVLYHHGSMNDAMRNYTEYLYRQCKKIKYLVSNSTLLEGVNLPIQKMFLLSTKKGLGNLRPSQFKNLIGRINRFSEIFSNTDLKSLQMLEPEIHIIGTDKYSQPNSNFHSFCEKVMGISKPDIDRIENVLLEGVKIDDKNIDQFNGAVNRLENLESGITEEANCQLVKTEVGLKLLESNINEIEVFSCENNIELILEEYRARNKLIDNSNELINLIYKAFISFIDKENTNRSSNLLRLESNKAQTFYAMFLDWKIENAPLPVMIKRFIKYWDRLPKGTPVFVGSWGDFVKENQFREVFTFMSSKSKSEKINLAIVRIKEEEDFFDYVIFRFIDILNDLNFINEDFYKLTKYGTLDESVIELIKNGFSRGVSELLLKNYKDLINFRNDESAIISSAIHQRLIDDKIGYLQRYEVSLNVISN